MTLVKTQNCFVGGSNQYGHAIYAAKDLNPSDIILEEKPAFAVPPPVSTESLSFLDAILCASRIQAADVDAQVSNLSPEQKEEYSKVAHEIDTDLSRFLSSHYDIRPRHNEAPTLFAWLPVGSYFNHSCRPNAMYRWNNEDKCMRWLALQDIAEGEEITMDYLPMYNWEDVTERRSTYGRLFPFECACPLCRHESSSSSAKAARERIRDVHRKLSSCAARADFNELISSKVDELFLIDEYLDLLGQHLDLTRSIDPIIYRGYYLASCIYSRNGKFEKARALHEKGVEKLGKCFDLGTAQYDAERDLCERMFPTPAN